MRNVSEFDPCHIFNRKFVFRTAEKWMVLNNIWIHHCVDVSLRSCNDNLKLETDRWFGINSDILISVLMYIVYLGILIAWWKIDNSTQRVLFRLFYTAMI